MQLVFIVAAHNRRKLTARSIAQALEGARLAKVDAHVVLFDDGSSDATAEEVRVRFGNEATIISGDGTAYWARSMSVAEKVALRRRPDALVWLNDDVNLDADAILRLARAHEQLPQRVLVCSMRDPDNSLTTYGGLDAAGLHPLSYRLVEPGDKAVEVDTLNGNLVLVPTAVAQLVGGIDGAYSHGWADIDYGVRLGQLGHRPVVLVGTFGECARNPPRLRRTRKEDWRYFISVKGGGNPRSTARLLQRRAPRTWMLWWLSTYAKWWVASIGKY